MVAPASDLVAPKLRGLFFRRDTKGRAIYVPSRYKVVYGGRGSAKSWGVVRIAAALGAVRPLRFLCVREYQNSIQESIHRLLSDQIEGLGLSPYYDIQKQVINGSFGTEFIFAGIKNDPAKIKSTEGVDVCLIEEAEKISEQSWKLLIPTIRKAGSEIWVVFNPRDETDPTYKRFVLKPPPTARVAMINWRDNPWFPEALELERQYALSLIRDAADDDERAQAQADYDHVWEGATQRNSQATIFRRRVVVESFDPPVETRFHYGADWGFANDPTALVRFWVQDDELWIDHEAFGYGVEIDELPQLFDSVIARTEVARTSSVLTQARAEHAGSTGYIWRTARDGDVRPSHKAMNGRFVRWGEPPTLDNLRGHAGCLPNCRCYADPVIPD